MTLPAHSGTWFLSSGRKMSEKEPDSFSFQNRRKLPSRDLPDKSSEYLFHTRHGRGFFFLTLPFAVDFSIL
jgi:hypothetical protein